jgi:micrococcal nuclease
MNKKASFFIAMMITLVLAGNYLFFADRGISREKVTIVKALDGDTVELDDGRRIRLLNINTPEKSLSYSELGKEYLSGFSTVELESAGLDRYERTLGKLYSGDIYLNLEIVKKGFAHNYLIADNEVGIFNDAEEYARNNELGIWERSEFYGCIDVEINKYDEYIDIIDLCGLDLTSWSVKDESTKRYTFKHDLQESSRLYSGKGEDTKNEIYWGRDKIWNDDHDRIFIRDSSGFLAYYYSY